MDNNICEVVKSTRDEVLLLFVYFTYQTFYESENCLIRWRGTYCVRTCTAKLLLDYKCITL